MARGWDKAALNAALAREHARTLKERGAAPAPAPFDGLEGEIHRQISEDIERRGWKAIHSRMDKPTTTEKGTPDFIVLADCGRTVIVEVKRGKKKPSPEQLCWHAHARKLGHHVFVVWSYEEYLQAILTLSSPQRD